VDSSRSRCAISESVASPRLDLSRLARRSSTFRSYAITNAALESVESTGQSAFPSGPDVLGPPIPTWSTSTSIESRPASRRSRESICVSSPIRPSRPFTRPWMADSSWVSALFSSSSRRASRRAAPSIPTVAASPKRLSTSTVSQPIPKCIAREERENCRMGLRSPLSSRSVQRSPVMIDDSIAKTDRTRAGCESERELRLSGGLPERVC